MKKIILITFLLASSILATDSTLIKELESRIKSGDKEAQLELGQMYTRGKGLRRDFDKAERLIRPLAIEGDVRAQYELGILYSPDSHDIYSLMHHRYRRIIDSIAIEYADSLGISKKPDSHYDDMLKKNHIQDTGSDWLLKNYSKYRVEFKKVGDGLTDYLPDSLVKHIRDSVFNDLDAEKWLLLAAEQGLADAQCALAWHYQSGHRGSKESQSKNEFYWLEQAAQQDHGWSQLELGTLYCFGYPLEKKGQSRAYLWLSLAVDKGLISAQSNMDHLMKIISEEQLQEGQKLLDQWYAEHPK